MIDDLYTFAAVIYSHTAALADDLAALPVRQQRVLLALYNRSENLLEATEHLELLNAQDAGQYVHGHISKLLMPMLSYVKLLNQADHVGRYESDLSAILAAIRCYHNALNTFLEILKKDQAS